MLSLARSGPDLSQLGYGIGPDDHQRPSQNWLSKKLLIKLTFSTQIFSNHVSAHFFSIIFHFNTCLYQNVANQGAQQMEL